MEDSRGENLWTGRGTYRYQYGSLHYGFDGNDRAGIYGYEIMDLRWWQKAIVLLKHHNQTGTKVTVQKRGMLYTWIKDYPDFCKRIIEIIWNLKNDRIREYVFLCKWSYFNIEVYATRRQERHQCKVPPRPHTGVNHKRNEDDMPGDFYIPLTDVCKQELGKIYRGSFCRGWSKYIEIFQCSEKGSSGGKNG